MSRIWLRNPKAVHLGRNTDATADGGIVIDTETGTIVELVPAGREPVGGGPVDDGASSSGPAGAFDEIIDVKVTPSYDRVNVHIKIRTASGEVGSLKVGVTP